MTTSSVQSTASYAAVAGCNLFIVLKSCYEKAQQNAKKYHNFQFERRPPSIYSHSAAFADKIMPQRDQSIPNFNKPGQCIAELLMI